MDATLRDGTGTEGRTTAAASTTPADGNPDGKAEAEG